jgi:hypothetical protein
MALARKTKFFVLIGLAAAILLAVLVSPFASPWPDGLEKVAEEKGFLKKGEGPKAWKFSPLPDYVVPGLGEGPLATAAAGFAGTVIVFLAGWGVACLVRSRSDGHENLSAGNGESEKNRQE